MPIWQIRVSDELAEAAEAKAEEKGQKLSEYVRSLVAKNCGDKNLLANCRKPGRPKNTNS